MAEKRIFTKKITESDAFLSLPLSSQCLYFHLNMNADDDGFVNSPKKVMRMVGASEDDFKLLLAKNFVIMFEEKGVIVIKHWWMHNVLRKDRYKETEYLEEKSMLTKKENGVYTIGCQDGTHWVPDGCLKLKEDKLKEDKLNKKGHFVPPTLEEVTSYCHERHNSVNAQRFIDFYQSKGWMVGKNKMKDWKACVRTWEKDSPKREEKETYEMDLSSYE